MTERLARDHAPPADVIAGGALTRSKRSSAAARDHAPADHARRAAALSRAAPADVLERCADHAARCADVIAGALRAAPRAAPRGRDHDHARCADVLELAPITLRRSSACAIMLEHAAPAFDRAVAVLSACERSRLSRRPITLARCADRAAAVLAPVARDRARALERCAARDRRRPNVCARNVWPHACSAKQFGKLRNVWQPNSLAGSGAGGPISIQYRFSTSIQYRFSTNFFQDSVQNFGNMVDALDLDRVRF